jgi:hypothetical protein
MSDAELDSEIGLALEFRHPNVVRLLYELRRRRSEEATYRERVWAVVRETLARISVADAIAGVRVH